MHSLYTTNIMCTACTLQTQNTNVSVSKSNHMTLTTTKQVKQKQYFKIHKKIMVAKSKKSLLLCLSPLSAKLCFWVHHYYMLYENGYTIITCFMEMGTPLLCALWKWVHHYYMLYKKEEKKKKSGFSYDLLSLGLVVNQNHGQWSSCDSDLETFFYNRKLSDILLDTWWDDISSLTAEGSVIQKIQTAQSCSEDDNPCLTLVFVSGKQQ